MLNTKTFTTKQETANALAHELAFAFNENKGKKFNIAISGGSTPFIMFDVLVKKHGNNIEWKNIHFYWVDERCVAPTNNESNFGNTKKTLFDKIDIPSCNIHRIFGENAPNREAIRYSSEIKNSVPDLSNIPQFDLILLGMGNDGHTASIFPSKIAVIESKEIAVIVKNPYNNQTRISLTGTVINNAKQIIFLVTGKDKSEVFEQIYFKRQVCSKFPAAHISRKKSKTTWYIDKAAAPFL